MAFPTADTYTAASGAAIYAGRTLSVAAPPSWLPAAGAVSQISYASSAHPQSLPATLQSIDPAKQSFNPTGNSNRGPWSGHEGSPAGYYYWESYQAYCGAVLCNTPGGWVYAQFGAGHSAINVPSVSAFRRSTRAWSWLCVPPPSDGLSRLVGQSSPFTGADVAAQYPAEQFDTTWGEWQGGWAGWPAGYAQPGKIFPEPSHSRNGLVWAPGEHVGNTNGAIVLLTAPWGRHAAGVIKSSHYFDLDANAFVRTANQREGNGSRAGAGCWVGGSVNRVIAWTGANQGSVAYFDVWHPGTKLWSRPQPALSHPADGDSCGMGFHAPSGLLLMFRAADSAGGLFPGVSGKTTLQISAVDAASIVAGTATTPVTLTVNAASWPIKAAGNLETVNFEFCPVDGCFYATNGIQGSTTLWKLSPPAGATTQAAHLSGTWTITTVAITSGAIDNGGASAIYVYNRLRWSTQDGCFIYFGDAGSANNGAPVIAIRPAGV